MKKIAISLVLVFAICFTACGNKAQTGGNEETKEAANEVASVEEVENMVSSEDKASTEEAAFEDNTDEAFSEIDAIGDVDVDKGLFDVTIIVPKDFIGDTTQEEIDKSVEEKGYKSGTLNDDGSVTYVMTKTQHKEMMEGVKESIDEQLNEMIGSDSTPNITDIKANEDYTSFTVTTKNTELNLAESFSVMAFYMYGGMYAIFNGETTDNIHIDYVNADSGEVISSADSKDMGE